MGYLIPGWAVDTVLQSQPVDPDHRPHPLAGGRAVVVLAGMSPMWAAVPSQAPPRGDHNSFTIHGAPAPRHWSMRTPGACSLTRKFGGAQTEHDPPTNEAPRYRFTHGW